MKTAVINGKEYLFVTLPSDAFDFKFDASWELAFRQKPLGFRNVQPIVKLNPNHWEIVGKELTEEQWEKIVEWEFDTYLNYMEEEKLGSYYLLTASESGNSLLASLNLKPETTLILIRKPE